MQSGNGSTEKDILAIGDVTKWSVNLAILPSVESCDIMVHPLNDCGLEASRLTSYMKDNAYKLHRDNHISDVTIAEVTVSAPYI